MDEWTREVVKEPFNEWGSGCVRWRSVLMDMPSGLAWPKFLKEGQKDSSSRISLAAGCLWGQLPRHSELPRRKWSHHLLAWLLAMTLRAEEEAGAKASIRMTVKQELWTCSSAYTGVLKHRGHEDGPYEKASVASAYRATTFLFKKGKTQAVHAHHSSQVLTKVASCKTREVFVLFWQREIISSICHIKSLMR